MMTANEQMREFRQNQFGEEYGAMRHSDGSLMTYGDLGESPERNDVVCAPTPEVLAALPVRDLVRWHSQSAEAETLIAIELAIAERMDEVAEVAAAIVEQTSDLRIMADGYKEWAKKKVEQAKLMEAKAERLEATLLSIMQITGESQIQAGAHKVTMRANNPKVEIKDVALVPAEFLRTKTVTEPDKIALKKALQQGLTIDGCDLVQGWRIEVK